MFLAETSDLRERTALLERRVEVVDSRLRDRYVRVSEFHVNFGNIVFQATGFNSNVVPKGRDWLTSIRSAMVGLGVCNDENDATSCVLRIDIAGSTPKSGVFVVRVLLFRPNLAIFYYR